MSSEKQLPLPAGDGTSTGSGGVQMKQRLTLLNGVSMIVGSIVGSGIFLTPKGVQDACGSAGLSLLVWVLSGFFSLIGAVCYVELGTTIVKSGASYSYIKEAFGPLLGFVRMWISVLIIEPTVQAAIAVTFAEYLVKPFYPSCATPFVAVRLLAACCCLFITLMNCWSVKYGTLIQDIFSYAKIIALIVIMIAGLVTYIREGTSVGALGNIWEGTTLSTGGMALAMYSGLYSYAGWDALNFMVEELKDPYVNLPRAIYISIPLVTTVYMLANLAYYAVLTTEELASTDAVALIFAQKTLGSQAWIMSIFVAMSCFGALNSAFYISSRLYYVAAREGHLPTYFSMVSPEYLTPIPALMLSLSLTLVYLCVEDIYMLINFYSFMYWLTVGLSIFGQIYLRHTRPEMPRPIKFNIGFAYVFGAMCTLLVAVPYFTETRDSLIGTAILATGFPLYYFLIYNDSRLVPQCISNFSQKSTIFLQKLMPVLPQKIDVD